GGNPLACRTALATIDVIEKHSLLNNATEMGNYIDQQLNEKLAGIPKVKEIRGLGLMIGIELSEPCAELVDVCLQEKLLINVTAERVIRLLPPLIFEQLDADLLINTLVKCIERFSFK
ncbi:MAG: aminotransferase class III-fold pyridoxal phosphate-dependent enzyme, partial [Pseudomonadota bacterium]